MSNEPLLPTVNTEIQDRFLVIRFSDENIHDLELNITSVSVTNINTKWLRQMCRNARSSDTNRRRLKFIRGGAILNSSSRLNTEMARYFSIQDNDKFYIHCMVGAELLSDDELANEDVLDDANPSSNSTTTQAIGFDRLRAVGFSDEEIEVFREQFRRTYGDLQQDNNDYDDGVGMSGHVQNDNDIRELEEQWMETGVNTENGNINTNTDAFGSIPIANFKYNTDLLIGITVGFCLGIFGFLLMKIDGLFNKRQKMSLVAGMLINIMFCLVRGF